jgi:PLP dependent protein
LKEIAGNIDKITRILPAGVSLIIVSKTRMPEEILEAYNCNHRTFGENKVQELLSKKDLLPTDIKWHIIGHLQTNKVKYIVPFISMIESVDSVRLLEVINDEAKKSGRVIDVLLQVHIATEETKFGFAVSEIETDDWQKLAVGLNHIRIRGLMGMASYSSDMQMVQSEFRKLKSLFILTRERCFRNTDYFTELSMGMSDDWTIALKEGSTMIRVGSAIFGPRKYY